MNRQFNLFSGFMAVLFIMSFCGCSLPENACVPYAITGAMSVEDSEIWSNAGLEFEFSNRAEKTVKNFTLVFYLYDENGEPPIGARNNIVFKLEEEVDPFSSVEMAVSLDQFFTYVPEDSYNLDFLYVSSITYSDGTVWTDPFGLKSF